MKTKKMGKKNDGGTDFKTEKYTIDLKTMLRTVDMRDYFVHNLLAVQVQMFNPDYYIFASLNTRASEITFCGYLKKTELKDSHFIKQGTERPRSDGSKLIIAEDMYEIPQKDLEVLNSKEEITRLK